MCYKETISKVGCFAFCHDHVAAQPSTSTHTHVYYYPLSESDKFVKKDQRYKVIT